MADARQVVGGASLGLKVGSLFGPLGSALGLVGGAALGGILGGGRRPDPNAERFASGLTALACLRGNASACQAPRALFTSDYWKRRYPESFRKWTSFYSTGRAPWTERWVTQQIAYQAQRYGISVGQGAALGQQRLGLGQPTYGGGYGYGVPAYAYRF